MTIAPVVIASIVPAIIASSVFFLVEKLTNKGFKIFTIVSLIVMVLSFVSPFTAIPGVTTGYALVLCVMHIVVPASLLYFIYRAKQAKTTNTGFQTA